MGKTFIFFAFFSSNLREIQNPLATNPIRRVSRPTNNISHGNRNKRPPKKNEKKTNPNDAFHVPPRGGSGGLPPIK